MNEDYVAYEQAKKLNELGFDEETRRGYYKLPNGNPRLAKWDVCEESKYEYPSLKYYRAPTQCQVQKWLREVKDVSVTVRPFIFEGDELMYCCDVFKINKDKKHLHLICGTDSNSYEEALSLGIDKAIEFLNGEIDVMKF